MTDPVHVYGAHQSSSEAAQLLATFWPRVMAEIRNMDNNHFKTQELPLARIKKIMKQDEEVKMISAEAPVLFSKAAEIFISELSLRAWIHTEDNKRRTLQRNDIALAITKYDQFDFLIDIVPRDELKPQKRQGAMVPEQVQYYLQLAQMQQTQQPTANQNPQVGGVQVAQVTQGGHAILAAAPHVAVSINPSTSQPQIIQIQPPDQQQQHQQQQTQQQQQHQQVQAATHVQSAQQATQAGQQPVQLHVQPGAADLQQYAVQLASGAQMQYRLVPQIIQQPGGPPVVQLQAQPHQLQQTSGGQTVIAVQPAQSQQDGQQQSAEVNYSQIYQLAAAQGGGQGSIFITTHSEQTQDNQQETQPTE